MNDEIEPSAGEHRKIVHRALQDLEIDLPLAGHLTIEFEHRAGNIEHRHLRAGRCIERAVLAAAGGEAEHVQPVESLREPRPACRAN